MAELAAAHLWMPQNVVHRLFFELKIAKRSFGVRRFVHSDCALGEIGVQVLPVDRPGMQIVGLIVIVTNQFGSTGGRVLFSRAVRGAFPHVHDRVRQPLAGV